MKKYYKAASKTDCVLKILTIMKLATFLIFFAVLHVFAGNTSKLQFQSIEISGTVTDEKGEPLPGVSVIVKGTTKGTVTNIGGNYKLEVPDISNNLWGKNYCLPEVQHLLMSPFFQGVFQHGFGLGMHQIDQVSP